MARLRPKFSWTMV